MLLGFYVKVIIYYEKHSYIFYTPFLTVFNHKSHTVDLLVAEGRIISSEAENRNLKEIVDL